MILLMEIPSRSSYSAADHLINPHFTHHPVNERYRLFSTVDWNWSAGERSFDSMTLHPASVIRVSIAAMWLLSPPLLALLALRLWKRKEPPIGWKAAFPLITAASVLANWVVFIAFVAAGQIGGFGSHYMTTRLADVFLLVSLLVLAASILTYVGRWQLSLASALMLALWFGSEMVA